MSAASASCPASCECQKIYARMTACTLVKQTPQPFPKYENGMIVVNPLSYLVLDASNFGVKVRAYTGSPFQIWKLECNKNGTFRLFNHGNEKFLCKEIRAGVHPKVITTWNYGRMEELWKYDSNDQTLINCLASEKLHLDNWCFESGADVTVSDTYYGTAQRWSLLFNV